MSLDRRTFLGTIAAGLFVRPALAAPEDTWTGVATRRITSGPKFHWFGYYDKLQFGPDDRLVLSNEVGFEGRSPTADDTIDVGHVDIEDGDRWTPVGTSNAWGWQQGCMLQWRPTSAENTQNQIVWNDREADRFVCRLHDPRSGETDTIDDAIYTIDPSGRFAMTTDFQRIQNMRPGYGYAGVRDANEDVKAPADSGVRRVDLSTGRSELVFSYADAAAIPHDGSDLSEKWHYFNHLLVSPDSRRFIVLHRWRDQPARARGQSFGGGFTTRMFTINVDGTDPYLLDPSGFTSHFIWRDPEHICAWSKYAGKQGFFLYRDRTGEVTPVGPDLMPRNGHNTYLSRDGADWILNDTYPLGSERLQQLYLYHTPTNSRTNLAAFYEPPEFRGEVRCDLHPRGNRAGTFACVDSTHEGGRQMYLVDLRSIVGR